MITCEPFVAQTKAKGDAQAEVVVNSPSELGLSISQFSVVDREGRFRLCKPCAPMVKVPDKSSFKLMVYLDQTGRVISQVMTDTVKPGPMQSPIVAKLLQINCTPATDSVPATYKVEHPDWLKVKASQKGLTKGADPKYPSTQRQPAAQPKSKMELGQEPAATEKLES